MLVKIVKHSKGCNALQFDHYDKLHGRLRRLRPWIHPFTYRRMYLELERLESYCSCGVVALSEQDAIFVDQNKLSGNPLKT